METILSKESLDWFDKSRRQMQLLQKFFIDRTKFERKMESQWTSFSMKWTTKFEDSLKETKTPLSSVEQTMCDIFSLLVEESLDNARICGSALSLLERKPRTPGALLERWLADPIGNTTCYPIDEFKSIYNTTVTNLAKSEESVENSRKVLQEKTEVFSNPKVDAGNRRKDRAKADPREQLSLAKESYQQAVEEHRKMEQSYIKEMNSLHGCLGSYENNRLSVLKNALGAYQKALDEYENQRESRKAHLEEMAEYLHTFSVERSAQQWLNSLQEPFSFSDYMDDPFPVVKPGATAGPVKETPDDLEIMEIDGVDMSTFVDKDKDNSSKESGVSVVAANGFFKTTVWDDTSGEEFVKHKVVALQSYTNLLPDHLSFHTGQKIIQKKPANADGLAYGCLVTNKYTRRKEYGFYPENIVAKKIKSKKRRVKDLLKKK